MERLDCAVAVDNDANCATWCEFRSGRREGHDRRRPRHARHGHRCRHRHGRAPAPGGRTASPASRVTCRSTRTALPVRAVGGVAGNVSPRGAGSVAWRATRPRRAGLDRVVALAGGDRRGRERRARDPRRARGRPAGVRDHARLRVVVRRGRGQPGEHPRPRRRRGRWRPRRRGGAVPRPGAGRVRRAGARARSSTDRAHRGCGAAAPRPAPSAPRCSHAIRSD